MGGWATPEARRAWQTKNRERLNAQSRAWKARTMTPERREASRWSAQKASLQRNYGMTVEQLNAMREAQGDRCAVCGKAPDEARKSTKRWLFVDHDHNTGKIRALLCNKCNFGIGQLCDSPELLESAAAYLRSHRGN